MKVNTPHAFRITPLDVTILTVLAGGAGYVLFKAVTGLNYAWHWEVIPQYLIRFDQQSGHWVPGLLTLGLITTIRLSLWSVVGATILGTLVGLMRVSPRLFNRQVAATYVGLVRNTPPLVLIILFYFFLGDQVMAWLGVEDAVRNASPAAMDVLSALFGPPQRLTRFLSAIFTLALFEGAYIAEIVRAGVESIEKGQWDASSGLGMTRFQQMRHIVLPQAMRRMLPALAGQFISTIKDSAIVSIISMEELTYQGQQLMATTYRTFEVWIIVLLLYFVLTFLCSLLVRRIELNTTTR